MDHRSVGGLWDAPGSIWLYGFLRAASLGLPVMTGAGGVGIGLVLVPPLLFMIMRGSARAWGILLVFDSLSFAVLLATRDITDVAPVVIWLSGAALALLLTPSMRRWVTRPDGDAEPATDADGPQRAPEPDA